MRQIKITRCKDIYYLQYGGNRQVERILDYLYRDSTIHLTRKYQLYLKFKEARKHVEPCAA
ncbi:hypothetical protein [Desulfofundulus kuznetsovii]|uniref:hypothetical protein n=1 Tax=Desulfofundulus kuznetsovii TaxID=58135 RepID=UPI00338F26B1